MADPDVTRAATFLATHAVLLLGMAIVAAMLTVAAVVAVIRLAARHRLVLARAVAASVAWVSQSDRVRRALDRTRWLVPGAYVLVHLALGLGLVAALLGFVSIADESLDSDGDLAAFDVVFAEALHQRTSEAGRDVFFAISSLGSREVLVVLTAVVAALLVARGARVLAIGWVGAQAGGALLNMALKASFGRVRPEFADPMLAASSWSFPSGHAMGTFIACGVGAYLLLREGRSWTTATIVIGTALAWCLLMAFSRLYLGVHYLSDVVAGLVAGAAWVAVSVSSLEIVHRRSRGRGSRVDVLADS